MQSIISIAAINIALNIDRYNLYNYAVNANRSYSRSTRRVVCRLVTERNHLWHKQVLGHFPLFDKSSCRKISLSLKLGIGC